MQSFENNKDYITKYKEFVKFISDNAKYHDKCKSSGEKVEMLCYIGLYFNYIQRIGYLSTLEKRGNLDLFKDKFRTDYDNRIKRIEELDTMLFLKIFGKSYKKLSDNVRNKQKMLLESFIINELTEEFFLEFTKILSNDYEFFFYSFYEQIMNNKDLYGLKNQKDKFLYHKVKDFNQLCIRLGTLK